MLPTFSCGLWLLPDDDVLVLLDLLLLVFEVEDLVAGLLLADFEGDFATLDCLFVVPAVFLPVVFEVVDFAFARAAAGLLALVDLAAADFVVLDLALFDLASLGFDVLVFEADLEAVDLVVCLPFSLAGLAVDLPALALEPVTLEPVLGAAFLAADCFDEVCDLPALDFTALDLPACELLAFDFAVLVGFLAVVDLALAADFLATAGLLADLVVFVFVAAGVFFTEDLVADLEAGLAGDFAAVFLLPADAVTGFFLVAVADAFDGDALLVVLVFDLVVDFAVFWVVVLVAI